VHSRPWREISNARPWYTQNLRGGALLLERLVQLVLEKRDPLGCIGCGSFANSAALQRFNCFAACFIAASHCLPPGSGAAIVPTRGSTLKGVGTRQANVRFGSKADMCSAKVDVRSYPKSGHVQCNSRCPLCANSGHSKTRYRPLVDEFVNDGQYGWRDGEAKLFCRA
jgi:hypothetical protein